MKKILCFAISAIIALSLFSCNAKKDDRVCFDTVVYSSPEEYSSFFKQANEATAFGAVEFKDDTAEKNKSITILGKEYRLTYETSATLPKSDIKVHNYTFDDLVNARVLFDVESGEIVKYVNIPHTLKFSSELECKELIQSLIGEKYSLSDYEYKCTTHYYDIFDAGMHSQVVDGFHICDGDDKLGRYTLYHTKNVNGIKIGDHISGEFSRDSFSLEIYDLGHENDYYEEILKDFRYEDLEYSLKEHFKSNMQEKFVCDDVKIDNYQLFLKNGSAYILATSQVTVDRQGDTEDVVVTVQTISCIKSK